MGDMTRIEAFESLRNSEEYRVKSLINDLYRVMRNQLPSDEELDSWFRCYIDNDMSDRDLEEGILRSEEFNNNYNV